MRLHQTLVFLLIGIIFACFNGLTFGKPPVTRNQAFQAAKTHNNIPRSKQPYETVRIPDKNTGQSLRQYNYVNNRGEKVSIRQDIPRKYGAPGGQGDQGHHFNAGASGGKLKQHWNFDKFNSKRG